MGKVGIVCKWNRSHGFSIHLADAQVVIFCFFQTFCKASFLDENPMLHQLLCSRSMY